MNDFFGLQPLLIARIAAEVPGLTAVFSGIDYERTLTLFDSVPAVYVLYDNYALFDQTERETQINQNWSVVLVVASLPQLDITKHAGPVLWKILRALVGWQPDSDYYPLKLESASKMTFQPAPTQAAPAITTLRSGLWHIPLSFSTTIFVTGDIP